MNFVLAAAFTIVLQAATTSAYAHRLDEYLQATTFSLEKHRVQVDIRLVPGVLVVREVLAAIDADKDGVIADAELRAYGHRLQRDLALAIDAKPARLQLVSSNADDVQTLSEGVGEIRLRFVADVPPGGARRSVVFENKHHRAIASYLVNCLVPADPSIRISAQHRNHAQSRYQLAYTVGAPVPAGTERRTAIRSH